MKDLIRQLKNHSAVNYYEIVSSSRQSELVKELKLILDDKKEKENLMGNDIYFHNFEQILSYLYTFNHIEDSIKRYEEDSLKRDESVTFDDKNTLPVRKKKTTNKIFSELNDVYAKFRQIRELHMPTSRRYNAI